MTDKLFIDANHFLIDSFTLAKQVLVSDFKPNFIVAIWRGGTPVGIAVQEFLAHHGIESDHIAIRTSAYEGIDKQKKEVNVHGLSYITTRVCAQDRLLLVDDVFDTGLSIKAVIDQLRKRTKANMPHIKSAVVYYKPTRTKVDFAPDFFVRKTDKWLIFPHELIGLTEAELEQKHADVAKLLKG
ncbi:MAG: hypoxanthine phosphoribosyltransferase [Candidatus Woesearchaeota archaeon]|nr:MAG: hypoxanthine phosphoribosyltransferase [Candidatus Woesearchaeota archaeon]